MIDKTLLHMLGSNKKYLYIVLALSIVGLIASIAITAIVCVLLAHASGVVAIDIVAYIVYALICAIIKVATIIINSKLREKLGNSVKLDLRHRAYDHLLSADISTSRQDAYMTQMIIEGVEQIDMYYTMYLPSALYAMVAPLVIFVVCLFLHWQVGVILLACLPLIPVSIVLVSKYAKKIFAKYWGQYIAMGDTFWDTVSGFREIKIFDAEVAKRQQNMVRAENFRRITMKVLVMQLCSLTIIDIVAFAGAGIAISSALSGGIEGVGAFVVLFLILLSAEFFLPMKVLASSFHVSMNGATAGRQLDSFINAQSSKWGDDICHNIDSVALQSVTFSYDDSRTVLQDVSLVAPVGTTAIVGSSGSGKSTIVSLLLGAHSANSGSVFVDGSDVHSYNRDSYYSNIAYVSSNSYLFNMSIRDNFTLACSDATDEQIMQALDKVHLVKFASEVGGIDHVLQEDSGNISGGQRQRLAIAIATLSAKSVYIFDEATSNIDVESETVIIDNIYALSRNAVTIVISHRLANVVRCDNIYVLDDGRVAEQGTHHQLMANSGVYHNIFSTQLQQENSYREVLHD